MKPARLNLSETWPADTVERRPVAALVPYARNARTHSEAQVAQLAGAIREWGWTNPVLVDEDGTIIAGHGRVLAAQKLDLAEVPVMVARGWTEAQRRAYVLADNKLALNAGWDTDMLRVELAELQDLGVELDIAGFTPAEIGTLLGAEDLMDPTDGEGETAGAALLKLKWQDQEVPLSAEEGALLTEALRRHEEVQGVRFGFVRGLLGDV